jgi:hypothetical protein
VSIIENGDLVVFGFISSKPFRVWVETVSGRLKSDFRIGGLLPYNNFPFPEVSDSQATDLISASQAVIDARELFPSNSLADLYDPNSMPSALRKAHDALDRSVMKAFDMKPSLSDPEILAALFIKYEEATKGLI